MLHFIINIELDDLVIESYPLIQIDFEEKQFTSKLELQVTPIMNHKSPSITLWSCMDSQVATLKFTYGLRTMS